MIHVSHSRLKIWRRCHKRHDYRYNQRLQKKTKAAPLLRGSILHEMLDARANNTMAKHKKSPYSVSRKYEKKYRSLFREQQEEYGETFIEDIDRVFAGYERAYAKDPLTYEYSEVKEKIELVDDIELVYVIDKIATDSKDRRWLIDHKTHKIIPDEEARFSDLQLVLYYWAWNEQHPKEQLDGVMWDYLRTKPPAIPEVLKNGSLTQRQDIYTDHYTYAAEIARLKLDPRAYKDILTKLQARGSSNFFQRIKLPGPSEEMIESIIEDARESSVEIREYGEEAKSRNMTKDCRWDCDFYRLCHAEVRGLDADFVRKADYEERTDDADETIEVD